MSTQPAASPLDLSGLVDWLVDRGLRGISLEDLVHGFCRRVVEAGFAARRFNMIIGTLHPRLGARSYIWQASGLTLGEFPRQRTDEERARYRRSPIHHLQRTGEERLRRRVDTAAPDEFGVFADLRAAGMTEYAARLVRFDAGGATGPGEGVPSGSSDSLQPLRGVFFSCATDAPGGFDSQELRQVDAALPFLALAVKSRSTFDVARTLLETYLGADAGQHVLTGRIDRHSVQRIHAVIWLCDLRGFSGVASRVPQEELIEILDAYLDAMARPVLDHGGQILKFLGDGFLATFDLAERDRQRVCVEAMAAARTLIAQFPRFNAERRAAGRRTLDFGVALHLGEVLYGNIGAADRLDFTVVGPTVNEASRIEGMCRPLARRVLVSSSFREAATSCGDDLVSLGFHALRGIREPQEIFTIAGAEMR